MQGLFNTPCRRPLMFTPAPAPSEPAELWGDHFPYPELFPWTQQRAWYAHVLSLAKTWVLAHGHAWPRLTLHPTLPLTNQLNPRTAPNGLCCAPPRQLPDGVHQIYLEANMRCDLKRLGVLLHEICHAIASVLDGHGPRFRATMQSLGLTWRKDAGDQPSPALAAWMGHVLATCGPYPHIAGAASSDSYRQHFVARQVCWCPACGRASLLPPTLAARTSLPRHALTSCTCVHVRRLAAELPAAQLYPDLAPAQRPDLLPITTDAATAWARQHGQVCRVRRVKLWLGWMVRQSGSCSWGVALGVCSTAERTQALARQVSNRGSWHEFAAIPALQLSSAGAAPLYVADTHFQVPYRWLEPRCEELLSQQGHLPLEDVFQALRPDVALLSGPAVGDGAPPAAPIGDPAQRWIRSGRDASRLGASPRQAFSSSGFAAMERLLARTLAPAPKHRALVEKLNVRCYLS